MERAPPPARRADDAQLPHFAAYVDALAHHGERVALTRRAGIAIEHVTFRALRTRAHQVARLLQGEGVVPGDRVLVVGKNGPEWVELLLGTLVAGATLVAADTANGADAAVARARQTAAVLAFCDDAFEPALSLAVPTLRLRELRARSSAQADDPPGVELRSDLPAVILFTSGTTADPKGVVLTHANLLANVHGIRQRIRVEPDWRLLSVLPLSHAYELTGSLTVLAGGAQIVYPSMVTPALIARSLVDFQITTVLAVPELLTVLLARVRQQVELRGHARGFALATRLARPLPRAARRLLFRPVLRQLGGRLDLVVTGGAPIPFDVAAAWERMGVRTVQGYGLTETSPILTVNALHHRRLDSPGRPLANVALRIGPDGEIEARGPSVFGQYWGRPDATAEAFTTDGWFRTGDVGALEHGWLTIEGRLKFAIVRASGLKVFPEDVELAAEPFDPLGELCVVGVTAPAGESVVAVLRSDAPDGAVDAAVAQLNARLLEHQHVDGWRRWPEETFPRTRLGKIDRRAVRAWANAAPPPGEAVRVAPPEEVVDAVASVIRANLVDPTATLEDASRLGDLGLDSLGRLNVVVMLEERLGVFVGEDQVTPVTTVGELRALQHTAPAAPSAELRPRWPYWRWVRAVGTALRELVIDGIVRIWVRVEVVGAEHLEGLAAPALFVFNHTDDFDGPVVWRSLPVRIRRRLAAATADDVLRDHRVLAFIVRLCFAGFSFARTEPLMGSFEYVGQLVDRGWNVAIAPEGRISTDGRLHEFKSGIGVLAVSLGVPVVPVKTVGLAGTVPLHAKWPRKRSRATVLIGRPLCFGPSDDYRAVTSTLHRAVEAM